MRVIDKGGGRAGASAQVRKLRAPRGKPRSAVGLATVAATIPGSVDAPGLSPAAAAARAQEAISMLSIRKAISADEDKLWQILEPVIRAGETYDLPREMSRGEALLDWLAPANQCFVACDGDRLLGTYVMHPNRQGGGSHVANCGYMTANDANGRGVARAMCAHSLDAARAAGFRAMQFNFVIASNHRAVKLWHGMGFETVGRVPEAFLHPVHGYTDALVMYQRL